MMNIGKASSNDLDDISEIDFKIIGRYSRRVYLAKSIESDSCLIAKLDGVTVGFAVCETSFFGHCFISLVLVDPQNRRQGIARGLIQHIELLCPTEKLFTSTNESNKVMQHVCESLGFVRSGMIENLDEGDPEIVFFKRVEKV